MRELEVFTAVMGLSLFLLYFPNTSVLAADATSLDVTAPNSVDIYEDFSVTAVYRSNNTNLCNAACTIDGGWLSGSVSLSETPGCEYSRTINAPDYQGSYTLDVYCDKAGYDYQSEDFEIFIEKLGSDLSITFNPTAPYAGESVTVDAYYEDDYNNVIIGSCNARLEEGRVEITEVVMSYYGGRYRGEVVLPPRTGDYTIVVTCTSEDHKRRIKEVSFGVRKQLADLKLSYPGVAYYGQDASINAEFTHLGDMVSGSCTISFNNIEDDMGYSPTGYSATVRIPYVVGQHRLFVKCSSDSYESREMEAYISTESRPTAISAISPTKSVFYPTDRISIKILYMDSLTGEIVSNGLCILDESDQLEMEDDYFATEVSNLEIGTHSFSILCSEQFHQKTIEAITLSVVRIPVNIDFVETSNVYMYGEEIKIKARVAGMAGDDADVSCSARVDSYDLLLNNLLNYSTADLVPEDGMQVLTIQGTETPSRMAVTETCSGEVYAE
jgi:hypothetical protein